MMYRWPPNCLSQSKHAKCFMCQARPSASVHSSAKIIYESGIKVCISQSQPSSSFLYLIGRQQAYLITSRTTWLQSFCMMTTTIKSTLAMEVNQVHQKVFTNEAIEASRMPANIWTKSCRVNCNIARHCHLATLKKKEESFLD